jgi:hypothetical protein
MSKFIVSKNLLNKFAHGELILLTENYELPFSLRAILVYTHDTISIYTQIAQSKENLLTVKKNCSRKSNLLLARICTKNLLTAEICSQNLLAA